MVPAYKTILNNLTSQQRNKMKQLIEKFISKLLHGIFSPENH